METIRLAVVDDHPMFRAGVIHTLGDPNMMSWGFMVGAARTTIRQAWWASVFPGIAILLTVLAINLFGEGLSDVLNPRLSRRRG